MDKYRTRARTEHPGLAACEPAWRRNERDQIASCNMMKSGCGGLVDLEAKRHDSRRAPAPRAARRSYRCRGPSPLRRLPVRAAQGPCELFDHDLNASPATRARLQARRRWPSSASSSARSSTAVAPASRRSRREHTGRDLLGAGFARRPSCRSKGIPRLDLVPSTSPTASRSPPQHHRTPAGSRPLRPTTARPGARDPLAAYTSNLNERAAQASSIR